MTLPTTDPARPVATRPQTWLAAAKWASAGAVVTGGLWAGGLLAGLSLLKITPSVEYLRIGFVEPLVLAIIGGLAGLIAGLSVGLARRRSRVIYALCALGALAGAVGGGLSLPTMLLCARWLHPLVSSSLLWAAIGLFVGLWGFRWSHRLPKKASEPPTHRIGLLTAAEWGFATAFCAGGAWVATLFAVQAIFGIAFPPGNGGVFLAFLLVASDAALGLFAGVGLAVRNRSGERGAAVLVLGIGGVFFGALTGVAGILAVFVVGNRLPPLVSSSLGVAIVGFFTGVCGSLANRLLASRVEPEEDEDTGQPGAKVEWLLREPKRKCRINRSLLRVSPVFLATGWALVGAVLLAPADVALALLAVGVLGLCVAFVLYRQEERLESLERRGQVRITGSEAPSQAREIEKA